MPRLSESFLIAASVLALASLVAADAPADEPAAELEALPPIHLIEPGSLKLTIRAEARLEAGTTAAVRLTPEAYSGAFEITAIDRKHGRVEAGDPIVHFDDELLKEQIRNETVSIEETTERLAFERQELDIMREANETRVHRAEKALADAELALDLWESFQGERMLRAADLATRQRHSGVLNQREELAQLQSMYAGAELESATREIVLERAQRGLAIAEEWLDIVREDERIIVDHTHAQRTRDVRDEARYRAEALDHARLQAAIGEARKLQSIAQMTRSHEQSQKRLKQLQADRTWFTVKAPIGGLLARTDREPGDRVNARQVVAEIHDDSSLRLTFNATPNDLRVLREGQAMTVRLRELPEVVMSAVVEAIEPIGRASGSQTHFAVEVRINEPHPLARIGLSAQLEAEHAIADVLTVPRSAVTWENGRAYVELAGDDGVQDRREVILGASNDDAYQVIDGLTSGDAVVLPGEE